MLTYEADDIDLTNNGDILPDLDSCCKKIMLSKLIIPKLLQAVVPKYPDSEADDIVDIKFVLRIGNFFKEHNFTKYSSLICS